MLNLENLTITSLTNHYVILDGVTYREAWVEDLAGCVRFVAIRRDLLGED